MRYLKFHGHCIVIGLFIAITAYPSISRAQGVFDLGALTNTLTVGTSDKTTTAAPIVPAATFTFQPSPEVRRQNVANFVKAMREVNADAAGQMEQAFATMDVIDEIGKGVAPFGLRNDNIVDAYTVYLINAWMASNGRTDVNTKEQADGTRNMVLATFSAAPDLQKLTQIDKQKFAEALLLQAFLYDAMLQATASDPAALARVKNETKAGAKAMGIDVDQFDLTANGLIRKK
jgi:hypothetical protein